MSVIAVRLVLDLPAVLSPPLPNAWLAEMGGGTVAMLYSAWVG
jgi:hypothetical protein